jgi:hypothetical protein
MKRNTIAIFTILLFLSGPFISHAQQLTWRMTNPRISNGGGVDTLVFDIEVQCNTANTFLAGYTAVLGFDVNAFVDIATSDIDVKKASHYATLNPNSNPKYNVGKGLSGSGSSRRLTLTLVTNDNGGNPGGSTWFEEALTSWHQVYRVGIKIENNTLAAGMFFRVGATGPTTGTYRALGSTTVSSYIQPHIADTKDFKTLYLGRIYSHAYGWTQVGGSLNWGFTPNLNTSVWDTLATINTTNSLTAKLRIHPSSTSMPGGKVKILPGGQLTCSDSTIIESANGLWIASSTTGGPDGSYIDNGVIIYGATGSGLVERYITQNQWHTFCIPVTTITTLPFNKLYMKWYDEPNHKYRYVINPPLDSALNTPLLGYFMWSNSAVTGNATVQMSGILNTAPSSPTPLPITSNLTRSAYPGGSEYDYDGWNFVGNPFPSATDIEDWGWTFTNLDPVIYYYDGLQYKPYNRLTRAGNGSRYTPPMQGFFVHVDATNPTNTSGTISVNNSARYHNIIPFYKEIPDYSDLLILNAYGNGISDESWVNFNESATLNFDSQFDAYKLYGVEAAPQLYSIIPGTKAAINVLPWTGINQLVSLGFSCGLSGSYSITANNLSSFKEGVKVYLEDKLTGGPLQDLTTEPTYEFNYSAGEDPGRFILHFTNNYFGVQQVTGNNLQIYSFEDYMYVKNNAGGITYGEVSVYDLMGRLIFQSELQNIAVNKYRMNVVEGYYLVKVVTATDTYNQKIYLK